MQQQLAFERAAFLVPSAPCFHTPQASFFSSTQLRTTAIVRWGWFEAKALAISKSCLFALFEHLLFCTYTTEKKKKTQTETAQIFSVRFVWAPRRTLPYAPESKGWLMALLLRSRAAASACCLFWALSRETEWFICFVPEQVAGTRCYEFSVKQAEHTGGESYWQYRNI